MNEETIIFDFRYKDLQYNAFIGMIIDLFIKNYFFSFL